MAISSAAARPDPSDHDLVNAIAAGDANALRALSARYAPVLTAIGVRLLNNPAEAEEIASDTLWRAWSEAKSYDAYRSSVGEWLVTIARRRARDRLRQINSRRDRPPGPGPRSEAEVALEHERIVNLLPLAAVDRLEPEQTRRIEDHLRNGCARCNDELGEWRKTATALDGPDGPESKIWQRLEARLHADAAASHSLATAISRPRRPERGERQSSAGWWRGVAVLAAAVAVLLFAYNRIIISRGRRAEVGQLEQLESLSWQLNNLRSEVTAAQLQAESLHEEVDAQEKFDRLLMAPDVQLTRLQAAGLARGVSGLIAYSTGLHAAMVQALGLPASPPGKTYEVWWITRPGGAVKAGAILAQPGRAALAPISMPPSGQRMILATVTLEPLGGAGKAAGPTYLKGAPDRE
jgi:DNA-directed RNA polymerase specialized sigma24 family protein